MRRREFIGFGGAAAWPVAARAQQPDECGASACSGLQARTIRTGRPATRLSCKRYSNWAGPHGRNVRIDYRWPGGDAATIRKYADELVALAPDVILSTGNFRPGAASGDPHRADCVRGRRRPSRLRFRR